MLRQFITFSGFGAMGTAAHFATLALLVEQLGIARVAASTSGFVIGAIVNYLLNYHFTFKSQAKHGRTLPKYISLVLSSFCLTSLLMYFATAGLQVHYLAGQVIATGLVLLWNYAGSRYWIFPR